MVICNVNPGFERPNPWVLNLRAQPHAQVQIGRDTTSMTARPASDDELDRYWPQLTKVWPAYQAFYDNGGKRSVFVLEPDGPPAPAPEHQPVHNAVFCTLRLADAYPRIGIPNRRYGVFLR